MFKSKKILKIVCAIFIILLSITFIVMGINGSKKSSIYEDGLLFLEEGWTIDYNETDGKHVNIVGNLPYYSDNDISEDGISISRVITEDMGIGNYFYIEGHHHEIHVYVEGEERLAFGTPAEYDLGKAPASGFCMYKIQPDDIGKTININYKCIYQKYIKHLRPVCLGTQSQFMSYLLDEYRFDIVAGLLFLVSGVFWLIIYFIFSLLFKKTSDIDYIGFFGILLGLWILFACRGKQLFISDILLFERLGYILMGILVIPVAMFVSERMSKKFKIFAHTICFIVGGTVVVEIFLQLFDIVDLCISQSVSMVLLIISLVLLFVAIIIDYAKYKAEHLKAIFISIIILIVAATYKILSYLLLPLDTSGNLILYFGVLVMLTIFGASTLKEWILIEQSRRNLDYANKAKSDFLANMSHEIRTPITAVLGLNEMILRESKDPSITDHSIKIKNAGNMLLSIVNDILDFSKIESGKMELVETEYNSVILFLDVYNMIRQRAEGKGLDLLIDIDENFPVRLYGDDMRLRQVITNILTNAVKYTRKGSVKISVKVLSIEGDILTAKYSVTDTGIGIKEEDISTLFESFRRLDQKQNRNVEGTGLGLSITSHFLIMMDSQLQVESEYGKGSTFYFVLKQKIVDADKIGNFEEASRSINQANEIKHGNFIAPKAKVLVVDDNSMNLEVIQGLLKETQIQITTADCGTRALELVRAYKYDLVFLDHMMPEMDGVETLKNIRRIEREEKAKDDNAKPLDVVVLTANAITGARDFYISQGFQDYLVKPIDNDEMERMLRKYIPEEYIIPVTSQDEAANELNNEKDIANPDNEQEDNSYKERYIKDYGINLDEGIKFSGGKPEKYKMMLNAYVKFDGPRREKIKIAFDNEDMPAYAIEVHALKSNAKGIGAGSLSELALTHEQKSKAGDIESVKETYDQLVAAMDTVIKGIAVILEEDSLSKSGKLSGKAADTEKGKPADTSLAGEKTGNQKSDTELLKEYVNSYDRTAALKLINEWSQKEKSEDILKKLNSIKGYLLDFELELAVQEVNSIANN